MSTKKEEQPKKVEQKVEQKAVVTPLTVYGTNPKLLILYGHLDSGRLINVTTGGPLSPLNFTHGNEYLCEIYMINGGPGAYNHWSMNNTSKVAVTDGLSIVYVNATSIAYVATPYPKITFQLKLDSQALSVAMANAGILLPAYLEFQGILTPNAVVGQLQKFTATSDQPIRKSALFLGMLANITLPLITGGTSIGATLTCNTGTWSSVPTSYTYQWKRDGVNISGETTSTHVIVTADLGHAISCTVGATNTEGTASATSIAVAIPSGGA